MKQFAPRIRVRHYGIVSGTGTHDLEDWLGEGCTVHTHKSIREPMGRFTISFVDKKYPGFEDSVYHMVAPMDGMEIRFAHDGSRGEPPLVMRGFVSDVRREEMLGQDGRPVRRVTIVGHDVGKLLVAHRIYMLPNSKEAGMQMTRWGPLIKYFGSASKHMTAAEFVTRMAEIIDLHLHTLLANSQMQIQFSAQPDIDGVIPPLVLNSMNDVSYHQFMGNLLDVGAFNEMFTRDDEAGAVLHVRPNFTQEDGITLTGEDVQSVSHHRTDANVANWYWARVARSQQYDQMSVLIQARNTSSYDLRQFEPCREEVYGWRKMEVAASLFPPGHGLQDAPLKEQTAENQAALYEWLTNRQATLVANNVYNALYEDSDFRVSGNESATAGTWMTWNKGETTQRHYIISVDHEFQVYGSFTTVLRCERGDGYLTRMGGGGYHPELDLKGAK